MYTQSKTIVLRKRKGQIPEIKSCLCRRERNVNGNNGADDLYKYAKENKPNQQY